MLINEKKTKCMIFNYTDNHQFTTRLDINKQQIDVIDSTRLLGTIITNNLCWDLNTATIVRKANARMELIRRVAEFGTPIEDMKEIYILFVRSILEQSATVWHSSLTQENIQDLERVQKSATKIILNDSEMQYEKRLAKLGLETLSSRRETLCLNFAIKCTKSEKVKNMFPLNEKRHDMETRNEDKFKVQFANTTRLKNSPIVYMQKLLNENEKINHI